jgi:hypothetical protein
LRKNKERYGDENIIHISKSKLFLWLKILIPTISFAVLLIVLLTFILMYIDFERLRITLVIIVLVGWSIPMINIIKSYLDYKMDFVVVNSTSLTRYNQE